MQARYVFDGAGNFVKYREEEVLYSGTYSFWDQHVQFGEDEWIDQMVTMLDFEPTGTRTTAPRIRHGQERRVGLWIPAGGAVMVHSVRIPARILVPIGLVLAIGLLSSSSAAQDVHVLGQSGTVISSANAACPPEETRSTVVLFETTGLADYAQTARADTASSCGTAGGEANLVSRITDTTITVDMMCSSSLQGHRSSRGAVEFRIELEVDSPVAYTMSVQGGFAYEDSVGYPTTTGWSIHLVGVHEVQDGRPDVDETWSGHLEPGTYIVAGSCHSDRVTLPNYDDIWWWADGWATLTGSLSLEFGGQVVVPTQETSLGSLKAQFR